MLPTIFFYIVVFLYGIVIGSFLNVLIYRLPKKENIVTTRSHCMSCGYRLKWYDLIPIFSFVALGGKCRKCKTKLSVQYPLIEGLNGALYLVVFARYGLSVESLLYCLLFSALFALSVIDFRTYEIPLGINVFILTLGLIRVATDPTGWADYAIGFLSVSLVLYLLYVISRGGAIGGGDVKLMAACGLMLGWKRILLAFVLGCILGSVIHLTRMRLAAGRRKKMAAGGGRPNVKGKAPREPKGAEIGHVLAMGPYLSAGVAIAALYGEQLIEWYLGLYLG